MTTPCKIGIPGTKINLCIHILFYLKASMYMLRCTKCGYYVRTNFSYFCRSCYKIIVGKLQITNADFAAYINRSFNMDIRYPQYWRFSYIHKLLRCYYPSIKELASILESIIYLKMLLSKHPIKTRKLQLVKCLF